MRRLPTGAQDLIPDLILTHTGLRCRRQELHKRAHRLEPLQHFGVKLRRYRQLRRQFHIKDEPLELQEVGRGMVRWEPLRCTSELLAVQFAQKLTYRRGAQDTAKTLV